MTHVLDALGRIKEYWGSVALGDLDDYARGRIVRGGAVAWEAYDASTLGAVLIGTGPDVVSTTTPTFVGVVTFNAGITMGGASGVNDVVIPDNQAIAFAIEDDGAAAPANVEYMRVVTTNAGPAQAVVFNAGEVDVDFNIRVGAGISDPTDAFFVEGSTGRIFMGDLAPVYTGHVNIYDATVSTTASFYGLTNEHTKTAGVTDANDFMIGLLNIMRVNQVGGIVGTFRGAYFEAELLAGSVGTGGALRDMTGFHMYLDLRGGTVTRDAHAGFIDVDQQAANTVDRDLFGHRVDMDLAGTITRDLYGLSFTVGTTIANTVGGDLFAGYLEIALAGAVAGTTYMHFLQEDGNADFGYYQTTSAGVAGANYLEGKLTLAGGELEFTAASGSNLIEFPDALANALYFADDTTAINFQQFVTTAAGQATVFNIGEVDVDFRVAASGITNALFVQGSDGKVGINTATIPHGGIGAAMLALDGANASTAGPFIQITTASDDYPLLQLFPWSHDNVAWSFDAYFDGAWKSSDADSNFQIYKFQDVFRIRYDALVAVGNAVTWNEGICMTRTGKVGIQTDTIPHGAVGYAMLALDGTNSNAAGPHVQITTTADDYPLVQLLSWAHDNISLSYDAYFDGVWKSSDPGSSFQIAKTTDKYIIRYDVAAAGAAITWNVGIALNTSGYVNIGPTGTAATLLELENVKTLVANLADDYAACLTLDPGYTGAFTVDRHNYIDVQDVSLAGGAAVTDAAILRLDAALGTHKATTNADKTANAKVGTLKVNANGTIVHIQLYAT